MTHDTLTETRVDHVDSLLRGARSAAAGALSCAVVRAIDAAKRELDRAHDVDAVSGVLIAWCAPHYGMDRAEMDFLGALARAVEEATEWDEVAADATRATPIADAAAVVTEPAAPAAEAAAVYELVPAVQTAEAPADYELPKSAPVKRAAAATGRRRGRKSLADRVLAGESIGMTQTSGW